MLAIITGATKGIGRAITYSLANKGYDLAICSRNLRDLKEIKEDLEKVSENQRFGQGYRYA